MSTKIQTLERIRQLFIKDPATILFTGDSVSYNRYDFDPVPRTNGYDCYPGMQSWSFLLRDLFIQNTKGYLHGDIIAAKHSEIEGDGAIYCGYKKAYVFPQYGRVLGFTAKSPDDKLIVKYKADSHGKIALYMLSNPLKTSCRFDLHVNGKHSLSVSNSGENKLYQGFEPFIVELAGPPNQENKISFENIIPDTQDQSLSEIFLVGISSETVHVHMTGQGSTTCKWLDDNCEERILRYKPDLVFISLAGNDIILSDPETFERALRSVIQKGRSINPHCEFVLIPVPPTEKNTAFIQYDRWIYRKSPITTSFYDKVNKVAEETNACVVDTYEVFSGIPVNRWRYDNIHLTQFGNRVLCEYLVDLLKK